MIYHLMMFCWKLSEKHWLLMPFSWLGDWLEDYGLDHGHITLRTDHNALILAALNVYEASIIVQAEHPKSEEWAASLRWLDEAAEEYLKIGVMEPCITPQ